MIFIWSSDAGPFQRAVMLILFVLQLLPFLLNQEASFEHTSTTTTSALANRHNTGSAIGNSNTRTRTRTYRYSTSYTVVSPEDLPWKTLAFTFLVFFIVIFSLLALGLNQYRVWLRSRYENIAQNIEERQAREMQGQPQQEQQQEQQRQQAPEQNQPANDAYYDQSSRYWLITVFIFGLVSGLFVWITFDENLSDIVIFLGSLLQFAGFTWMMTRTVIDARQHANHNNNRDNPARDNPARLAKIVAKIRELPVEEFVPNDKETYSKLKISQLKNMLQNRGDTASYLEKSEMISALCQNRKYDDSCCICYQDYCCDPCRATAAEEEEQNNVSLRILPKCGHEFHLECLDQWAYTFERKSEAPSCPLCKTDF